MYLKVQATALLGDGSEWEDEDEEEEVWRLVLGLPPQSEGVVAPALLLPACSWPLASVCLILEL